MRKGGEGYQINWRRASAATRLPWFVRKDFSKQVVLERYPDQLRTKYRTHHEVKVFDTLLNLRTATLAEGGSGRAQQLLPGKRQVTPGEADLRPGKRL